MKKLTILSLATLLCIMLAACNQQLYRANSLANQAGSLARQLGSAIPNGSTINSSRRGPSLPTTYATFKANCQQLATSPEGAILMLFDAVYAYMNTATRSEGSKMMRYILHEDATWEKKPSRATLVERLRDPAFAHIFRSYANGATPQNDYAMNPDNYGITIAKTRQESDHVVLSVVSNGADSPRPFSVKRFEDGLYYVIGLGGLPSGVRPPASASKSRGHDADYD